MRMTKAFVFAAACSAAFVGCNNVATRMGDHPEFTAALNSEARDKIEHGIIEPGFTPEMVYLALGKPTSPPFVRVEQTRDGTWIYQDFRNERDFIRAGFRQRIVFDPVRRSDVIITEPVDPRTHPELRESQLRVIFHDGRVAEIQQTTL